MARLILIDYFLKKGETATEIKTDQDIEQSNIERQKYKH